MKNAFSYFWTLAPRQEYELGPKLTFKKTAIYDEILHVSHKLSAQGAFIFRHLLDGEPLEVITALYASKFRVTTIKANQDVKSFIKTISSHGFISMYHFNTKRIAPETITHILRGLLVGILWAQWPILLLSSGVIALASTLLGSSSLASFVIALFTLVTTLMLHEFGHAYLAIRLKYGVLLSSRKGTFTVRYVSSNPVHIKVISFAGPICGILPGFVLLLLRPFCDQGFRSLLTIPMLVSFIHIFSLLPIQQDGKMITKYIKYKNRSTNTMKKIVARFSWSLGVFFGSAFACVLVGMYFLATTDTTFEGVKSLHLLGLDVIKLTASQKSFELSTGVGLLVVPLVTATMVFMLSVGVQKFATQSKIKV